MARVKFKLEKCMKKIIFAGIILSFLAAACNSSYQTSQPTSIVKPSTVPSAAPISNNQNPSQSAATSSQPLQNPNNSLPPKTYTSTNLNFSLTIEGDSDILENNENAYLFYSKDKNVVEQDLRNGNTIFGSWEIGGWEILTKHTNNDSGLQKFLQGIYGQTCKFGQMTPTKFSTTFDVNFTNAALPGDATANDCSVNSVIFIKYSPKLQEVATWDAGQSGSFINPDDETIAESFHFLK